MGIGSLSPGPPGSTSIEAPSAIEEVLTIGPTVAMMKDSLPSGLFTMREGGMNSMIVINGSNKVAVVITPVMISRPSHSQIKVQGMHSEDSRGNTEIKTGFTRAGLQSPLITSLMSCLQKTGNGGRDVP